MDYWAATLCPSLYKHLPLHTITCSTVTIENCAIDYVLIHLPIIFSHCKMFNFTPLKFPGSFCSLNSLIITSGRIYSPSHMCFKYVDLLLFVII